MKHVKLNKSIVAAFLNKLILKKNYNRLLFKKTHEFFHNIKRREIEGLKKKN